MATGMNQILATYTPSGMSPEDVDGGVGRDVDEKEGLEGTSNTSPIDRFCFQVAIAW